MHRNLALAVLSWLPLAAAPAQEIPGDPEIGTLGPAAQLELVAADLDVQVEGPAYQATVELTFHNPARETVEAVAWLPVAPASVERGFRADNNGIRMTGQVRSRDRAIRSYRRVTRETPQRGKDPVLVERIDDDWLRATIFPVVPRAEVRLTYSFVGIAERIGDLAVVRVPVTTLQSRYGRAVPIALHGAVDRAGDDLLLHAPDLAVKNRSPSDVGQCFEMAGRSPRDRNVSLYVGAPERVEPVRWSCYRQPGEDGYFLMDLDPAPLLGRRLEAARYVFVVDLPESSPGTLVRQARQALQRITEQLSPRDRVEVLWSRRGGGLFGRLARFEGPNRRRIDDFFGSLQSRGCQRLGTALEHAAELLSDGDGPARVVLVSGAREVADLDEALAAVRRITRPRMDAALFTLVLDSAADREALARITAEGFGRTFQVTTPEHGPALIEPFAAAVLHPVLRFPRVEVARATEVCLEPRRSLSYGESLLALGRYEQSGGTLVRLRGTVAERSIDEVFEGFLPDGQQGAPWVATLWAGRRLQELENRSVAGDDRMRDFFLLRLAERYGILSRQTACLALEPGMETMMPRLVGPGLPDEQRAAPVVAMGPAPERPSTPQPPTLTRPERERRSLQRVLGGRGLPPPRPAPTRPTAPTRGAPPTRGAGPRGGR